MLLGIFALVMTTVVSAQQQEITIKREIVRSEASRKSISNMKLAVKKLTEAEVVGKEKKTILRS